MDPAVAAAIETLLRAEPSAFASGADDPAEVAARLQALMERVSAARAGAVVEVEAGEAWRSTGATSLAGWVRGSLRLSASAAWEVVRTSRALSAALPATRTALWAGQCTWAHAVAITRHTQATATRRAAMANPEMEPAIVAAAEATSVEDLGALLRTWVHQVDVSGFAADESTAYEQRRVSLAQTLGGMWHLEGLLPPEAGAVLATALDAHIGSSLGSGDDRTVVQLRADALVDVAAWALRAGATPKAGGLRPQLVVLTPADTMIGAAGAAPGQLAHGGGLVSARTVERLACDALVTPVTVGGDGLPLAIGRTTRVVPMHLRLAVLVRDRRCAFPGCARPPTWCDAHHIEHWARGGPTDLANLVLLCRHHHTRVHELDVSIERAGAEWLFTLPGGTPLGRSDAGLRLALPLPRGVRRAGGRRRVAA